MNAGPRRKSGKVSNFRTARSPHYGATSCGRKFILGDLLSIRIPRARRTMPSARVAALGGGNERERARVSRAGRREREREGAARLFLRPRARLSLRNEPPSSA